MDHIFENLCWQVNENKEMPPIIILGNKKDLVDVSPDARRVSSQDVNDLISECERAVRRASPQSIGDDSSWSVLHYETSALTGEKVDSIFDNMVREIRIRRRQGMAAGERKSKVSWCFLL